MAADVLWTPAPDAATGSALARFMAGQGFALDEYRALHAWSVADLGGFWSAVWDFAGLPGDRPGPAFVPDEGAWMTGARFFPEARLNLAEVLLRGVAADVVVHALDEAGGRRALSRADLRAEVARVAQGLRQAGVVPGDRVAGLLANTVEALVALLATASLGGVWTSCSPDFGATAIADRIGQVGPKVLFAPTRYSYGGKAHDLSERVAEIVGRVGSIEALVLSGDDPGCGGALPRPVEIHRFDGFGEAAPEAYLRVPFDHPAYVLYTSGTTGAPKAIVHRTGGVVLQHVKEHLLHCDLGPGDALLWYSNTAWMMYFWMVSALATGAAVVLYDGAPLLKGDGGLDCSPLWAAAEATRATHLGVSPKYLATLAAEGYHPAERHDLGRLRALMSAGAPLLVHQFDWAYAHVKRNMMLASISGGTEILGCFMLGSPLHPVRRGQLTVPGLGHAVAVLDDRGVPVIGRRGALACTEPFPSMPLTFWGEDGDARYRATYFAQRPEVWVHGDVAEIDPNGGGYVHGRSDATLKPGGVRIGTSEIYAACEGVPEVADCVVFGALHEGDEEVVLCVRLSAGATLDRALAARLRGRIRSEASPRHVPARIHAVADVPTTVNGKRVEAAARAACAGEPVGNLASLANPDCLAEYRALAREASL